MSDEFTRTDMRDFMEDVFKPHLERFEKHMEADDRRFTLLTDVVSRVSTSIEVGIATQQALVAQGDRLFSNRWLRLTALAIALAPLIAVAIAIWK